MVSILHFFRFYVKDIAYRSALTREKKRDRILSGEREEISIKRKVRDITTESKARELITGIKSSAEFLWPMGAMKQVQ